MRVVPLPSSSPAIAKHTRTIKHKKRGMLVGVPPPFKNKKKRRSSDSLRSHVRFLFVLPGAFDGDDSVLGDGPAGSSQCGQQQPDIVKS